MVNPDSILSVMERCAAGLPDVFRSLTFGEIFEIVVWRNVSVAGESVLVV